MVANMDMDNKVNYVASRIFNAIDEDDQIAICKFYLVKLTKHGQINR
jgi:hypothetical protein